MAKITYTYLRDLNEGEKLAPQAKQILNHIKGGLLDRQSLIAKIDEEIASGAVQSVQNGLKLVGYYQKRLEEAGFITVTKEATAKEPKAPKAPKEKATVAKAKKQTVAPLAEEPGPEVATPAPQEQAAPQEQPVAPIEVPVETAAAGGLV